METLTTRSRKTSPFLVPRRFEASFRKALAVTLRESIRQCPSFEEIDSWINELSFASRDPKLKEAAQRMSMILVRNVNIHNVYGWRETARNVRGGLQIFPYLYETRKGSIGKTITQQIHTTTEAITNIPERISHRLARQASYARSQGATEQGVFNILRRSFQANILRNIAMVANQNPHLINSELTEARSEDLDVQCFIWTTSHDSHVRPSHRKLDGVLVFWRDLPSPEALIGLPAILGRYSPGHCPGCRCSPEPVLHVDDLFSNGSARIKVYYNDSIGQLTKAQLMEILD